MDFLQQPLENFTEASIQQALDKESNLSASIDAVDREIEKTQARLVEIKARFDEIERLTRAVGLARQERAEKLAAGHDHTEVTGQITSLQEQLQNVMADREILEDEQAGLGRVLEKHQKARIGLVGSLDSAQQDTKVIRFCALANKYNVLAENMAQLVGDLLDARKDLPKGDHGARLQPLPRPKEPWDSPGIFTHIPVLRMDWSDINADRVFLSRHR